MGVEQISFAVLSGVADSDSSHLSNFASSSGFAFLRCSSCSSASLTGGGSLSLVVGGSHLFSSEANLSVVVGDGSHLLSSQANSSDFS